jgi:hypothetical protein
MRKIDARVLLAALTLAAPALAAIPPAVLIRIGGAELVAENHYLAIEQATVSIAVTAKPGDTIWLLASSLDASGEPNDTTVIMLMLGTAQDGQLSGDFVIPAGTAGQSFQLEAHAMNATGEISSSTTVVVDIGRAEPVQRPGRPVMTEPARR